MSRVESNWTNTAQAFNVSCTSGDIAVGGGFRIPLSEPGIKVLEAAPLDSDTWQFTVARVQSGGAATLRFFVRCLKAN